MTGGPYHRVFSDFLAQEPPHTEMKLVPRRRMAGAVRA